MGNNAYNYINISITAERKI
jgi:hypothetical protein